MIECSNGSYGYNCHYTCSNHCQVPGVCDRKTGHCYCQVGWKPEKCDSRKNMLLTMTEFYMNI